MNKIINLVRPSVIPPFDTAFRPAVLANNAFLINATEFNHPLVFGFEQKDGGVSRFETKVFPVDHPCAGENYFYAERIFKFLLWQRGGSKVYIAGPPSIGRFLQSCYSLGGERKFDYQFMSSQVYERPLEIIPCTVYEIPPENDTGNALGRHLDGCRIGFDLGASDRKVSAVIDGQVVYSEEVIWDPRNQADPEYHYKEIISALKMAASKMPRVDAIGGSSAGIYIDNRPMVASLFRAIPAEQFNEIHNVFHRISNEFNVPLEVINDGDVSALAGSMSLGVNGILGVAMGSSEATGYIDMHGHIKGWLNELAFAPIDYSPDAPMDEWSGDIGCGAQYLSQQCVFRLALMAGIQTQSKIPDAEKLNFIQEKLQAGHDGAVKIWQSMGVFLGYALAHYAAFYDLSNVLLLGRCTSGIGGSLILEGALNVLRAEFPELASRLHIQLPDESNRRVGQSIAAASLPVIQHAQDGF